MNQKTATLIQDCQNAGGLAGPDAHQCRVAIVRTLTGRRVLSKDCGYHAAWKAIHADLDTPIGSCRTMEAWALQRVGEIAAQKDSEKDVDSAPAAHHVSRIGGNQADDKEMTR